MSSGAPVIWRGALLLAVALAGVLAPLASGAAPERFAPRLSALSAVRGPEARIVDAGGREILLRGANVNQLGDYYAKNEHPPKAPLLRSDFRRMRRLGWNQVRLVTNWSKWEPQPGVYSMDYLRKVRRAVRWAARNGIYTMIDVHQDAWGKFTAAAEGEICPPGLEPNIGWDGAPEWATITDGQPRCNVGETREISAAVAQAFQNFWQDREGPGGVGIQTRLVELWRFIATKFRGDPRVMGYDLINEPHPGFVATGAEASTIVPYYRRAIEAIRSTGDRHIIFVEPTVVRSGFPELITMPFVDDDPNLAYAPHIYGDRNNPQHPNPGYANEEAEWSGGVFEEARDAGGGEETALPVFIGEFGALDPPARDEYNTEFMRLAEKYLVGWSHWVWKDTCGDPHTDYGPFPDETMNRYDCESDSFTGLKRNRVFHYARPYPQRTVGRLERISFDEETKRFRIKARRGPDDRGRTFIWIPLRVHYGGGLDGVEVRVEGGEDVRLRRTPERNALLSFTPERGEYSVKISRP